MWMISSLVQQELCNAFEKLTHEKFQMSFMRELTFFLGLQVKQKNEGIFIIQDKYVAEILKKFVFTEVKNASTPMETQKPLLKDEDGKEVDVHMYRSMIGSLMYLISSRPDVMFVVYACARYQVNPKFWSISMAKTINGEAQIHAWVDGKEIIITESSIRRDLRLEDKEGVDCLPNSTIFENLKLMGGSTKHVSDEVVYKELDDILVRAATTASSLEAERDSGNVDKTQSKATPNKASSLGTTSSGGPRRVKKLKKKQRSRTYKLKRLYKVGLIARVDSFKDEQSLGKDASKQERKINDINVDEDTTLVNDQDDAEMFDVSAVGEVNAARIATTISDAATITTEEITWAQALVEIKISKPKAKGIVLQEPSESTTTTKTISSRQSQDKGKCIMVEKPMKLKKKDQNRLDEEAALKLQAELQAEFDEEQRLARERGQKEQEANIALKETWDDIQAKIDADYQMAERMEAEEQQELTTKKRLHCLFEDFRTELMQGQDKEKREREELTQESAKKQKVDDDKETTELKKLMEIILDEEEVVIDAIPLAVKSLEIVD
nr:hypothetical protein [Tanacetum cinerariifolium]